MRNRIPPDRHPTVTTKRRLKRKYLFFLKQYIFLINRRQQFLVTTDSLFLFTVPSFRFINRLASRSQKVYLILYLSSFCDCVEGGEREG